MTGIPGSSGNAQGGPGDAAVAVELADRISAGERGIVGMMLESFVAAGRQDLVLGKAHDLTYGRSITDPCLDWPTTATLLDHLATAVDAR